MFSTDFQFYLFVHYLDDYKISRKPDYYNSEGKPVWIGSTYSQIGKAVYEYQNGNILNSFETIVSAVVQYINKCKDFMEITHITTPPSDGKGGSFILIAKEISKRCGREYIDLFEKDGFFTMYGKSIEEKKALMGRIKCKSMLPANCRLLIIDDVIDSGATFTGCAQALRRNNVNSPNPKFLAITRTKEVKRENR